MVLEPWMPSVPDELTAGLAWMGAGGGTVCAEGVVATRGETCGERRQ